MAFDLDQFNLMPFNISRGNVKWILASGDEYIDAMIGSALQIFADAIGNERVSTSLDGMPVRFREASGSEYVTEQVADGELLIILAVNFSETVSNDAMIAADVAPVTVGNEIITENIDLGAKIWLSPSLSETVDQETYLSAIITPQAEGYELITETASLEAIEEKTTVLTVTLKPGDRLIVDASTYNVLLNSENAIYIQSGDWIDELNRNTTELVISASAGQANLSASILYTERFL